MRTNRDNYLPTAVAESQSIASSATFFRDNDCDHDCNNDLQEPRDQLSYDSTAVLILRMALIGVWLVVAVVFSLKVYSYTTRAEEQNFRQQYSNLAAKVFDAFQSNLEQSLWMMDLMSLTYTSYALDRNLTWPFVTLPDFEIVAARARHLVQNGGVIAFAPTVSEEDRDEWKTYSVANQGWADKGLEYRKGHPQFYHGFGTTEYNQISIPPSIWNLGENNLPTTLNITGTTLPMWQFAPIQSPAIEINYNILSTPSVKDCIDAVMDFEEAVLSKFLVVKGDYLIPRPTSSPLTVLFYPVFENFRDRITRKIVGVVSVELFWENFLKGLLPKNANGIVAVLSNTCDQAYTFEILGNDATYLGEGDLHDRSFDDMGESKQLNSIRVPGLVPVSDLGCQHSLELFPSSIFRDNFISSTPKIYTVAAASIFLFTFIIFLLYDWLVKRRHRYLKREANRSNAIVTSLFPTVVRDRLFRDAEQSQELGSPMRRRRNSSTVSSSSPEATSAFGRRLSLLHAGSETPKIKLKTFLNDAASTASVTYPTDMLGTAPIADLFPNTTVLFADIAGFTAWCSEREPTQVLILLETIYCAFDALAKRSGVFKVETIGDCYMAVTGLPDPQEDHAVIMATFAKACIKKMQKLTKTLEATLGPGTADLSMRVGLHSGPVTAGVLRGDKSRFQLFGDTVNTASRMESNGERDRIHISEETAMLLVAAGKKHWVTPREDVVVAKGKGQMQTYWLFDLVNSNICYYPRGMKDAQNTGTEEVEQCQDQQSFRLTKSARRNSGVWGEAALGESQCLDVFDPNKLSRLVEWNVDVLLGRLKAIIASRQGGYLPIKQNFIRDAGIGLQYSTPRDEVTETISLPDFDPVMADRKKDPSNVEICPRVISQLRKYVTSIASMYRNNAFHNFEHASHVTMSSNKLLQRIISPDDVDYQRGDISEKQRVRAIASDLHDITFGIASDTLTQFAVVFSALVHDVDHCGLSNAQIIQQQDPIAKKYKRKSVAEQNSIDVAWTMLMTDDYADLRRCIYSNESEAKRFRQLVVNSVMATDLFDSDLRTLRLNRWEKAFRSKGKLATDMRHVQEDLDRKATTVIEHIIQASDVAHTMQHWHIYQRWNEKLFHELFVSYQQGLSINDPSLQWYQGELDFFDNYIIPLANKLKESGVFGVSGDEYLIYAQENRKEWALKGEQIVTTWREQFDKNCSLEN